MSYTYCKETSFYPERHRDCRPEKCVAYNADGSIDDRSMHPGVWVDEKANPKAAFCCPLGRGENRGGHRALRATEVYRRIEELPSPMQSELYRQIIGIPDVMELATLGAVAAVHRTENHPKDCGTCALINEGFDRHGVKRSN